MGIFSKRRRKKNSHSRAGFLLRWFGPAVTSLGILFAIYLMFTGGLRFSAIDSFLGTDPETKFRGESISLADQTERPTDRIRVATFNLDRFADEKSNTRLNEVGVDVLGTLAKIVSRFDVVAVQEVQGSEGAALRRLVGLLNESGGQYSATMSDPIGEGEAECYAFLWDRSRLNLVPDSAYLVLDQANRMDREPMVATFESVLPPGTPRRPFRFTMINVKTKADRVDPNQTDSEINVLADVFQRVRQFEYQQHGEEDFILLGNLNVNAAELGQLAEIDGMTSLAADRPSNAGDKTTRDHILIDRNVTSEYAGRHGELDLIADLGLTAEQAMTISDHHPVWAEFERYERESRTATRPPGPGTRLIE